MQPRDGWPAEAAQVEGVVSTSEHGPVRAGVEHDLAGIAVREADLVKGGLAATARAMADQIDDPGNSATSKSMCAKALRDCLDQLQALAPREEQPDDLDALRNG